MLIKKLALNYELPSIINIAWCQHLHKLPLRLISTGVEILTATNAVEYRPQVPPRLYNRRLALEEGSILCLPSSNLSIATIATITIIGTTIISTT